MEIIPFILDDRNFNFEEIIALKLPNYYIETSEKVIENIEKSRKTIENLSKHSSIKILEGYNEFFNAEDLLKNQKNPIDFQDKILSSCLNGYDKSLKPETIRLILACKIIELSKGMSGISTKTFLKLVEAYNKNITPLIPKKSGLLSEIYSTSLAYLIYGLMGKSKTYDQSEDKFVESEALFTKLKYEPLKFEEHEILGLISGSKACLAQALEPIFRAETLLRTANKIFAVSFETLVGNHSPFYHKIHEIRNHKGQIEISKEIIKNITVDGIKHSEMNNEFFSKKGRLQDSYSFRCVCQIHGIILETLNNTKNIINKEINSVSTRPLVLPYPIENHENFSELDELVLFGGNFSDVAINKSLDKLCMAIHEIGSLSDRRISRINNPVYDKMCEGKLNFSGCFFNYLPIQSMTSVLVSENKFLCHPSSNDVTPYNSNKGDFYSMGALSIKKFNSLLNNVEKILAIEAILACQGIDRQRPFKSTPIAELIYNKVRKVVPFVEENGIGKHIETIANIIKNNELT